MRAICTVLLDPRDPLLQSGRMQGFAADPVYAKGEVFAYVGLPQNLKDLKAADPVYVKGEVFAYVGLSRNLKVLKDLNRDAHEMRCEEVEG